MWPATINLRLAAVRRVAYEAAGAGLLSPELGSIRRVKGVRRIGVGCGLCGAELLALSLEALQHREEHWVIADLVGMGGHVRTVPIPAQVKNAVDAWTAAADITHRPVFRAINKAGPHVAQDRADPVSARARLHPNDGTSSG